MDGKGIKLAGVITDIFPSEVYGNFEKRVLWLKQADSVRYPEHWAIEFQQGECNTLDNFKTGQAVEISIDIKGKAFQKKSGEMAVFTTLKATAITLQGQTPKTRSNRQQTGGAGRYDTNAYNDGEPGR